MALIFVFLFTIAVVVSPSTSKDLGRDRKRFDEQTLASILKDAVAKDNEIPGVIYWATKTTDPEVKMGPAQIIDRWDYPVEEYTVETDDHYLLSVQRIPGGRWSGPASANSTSSKPVLFLMHGVLGSATNWIANLPNQSLAFLAADAGFDVWLGNARGNTYSRGHKSLSSNERSFWEFSIDEIAEFDIPAMVDFALKKSQQDQLYYAGHSQGSMVMFAKASEDLEFGKKIKKFFALGPVTTVGHCTGPSRIFSHYAVRKIIETEDYFWGHGEFLPKNWLFDKLASGVCKSSVKFFCTNILIMIEGLDIAHINQTRLPIYLSHTPAGTSIRDIFHFGQLMGNGKFQKYDLGVGGNMKKYNTPNPPAYDVSKMQVPTVLFWGGKDILADPEDVEALIPKIMNLAGNYLLPEMSHLDFVWGSNAPKEVYAPMIRMMEAEEKL